MYKKVKKLCWKVNDLHVIYDDNAKEIFKNVHVLSCSNIDYYDNGKTMYIGELKLSNNRSIENIMLTNRQANVLDKGGK